MTQIVFDGINLANSLGVSFSGAVSVILALFIVGVLGMLVFTRIHPDMFATVIVFSSACAFVLVLSLIVLEQSVIKDSRNYPVGMCFKLKTDKLVAKAKREFSEVLLEKKKLTESLKVAKEIKAGNIASLEKSLVHVNEVLLTLEPLAVAEIEKHYVVLKQEKNFHLVYSQEDNKVDQNFNLNNGAFRVDCSGTLNEVVILYQTTGEVVAVNQ